MLAEVLTQSVPGRGYRLRGRFQPLSDMHLSQPSCVESETLSKTGFHMSEDYAHGRRDGLRLALSLLAAEEAKWAALLGESRSWRTNATREVRHKTLQVAQRRIRTVLSRLTPKGQDVAEAELASALDKLGL